jgi:hypothetical protein
MIAHLTEAKRVQGTPTSIKDHHALIHFDKIDIVLPPSRPPFSFSKLLVIVASPDGFQEIQNG